MGPHCRVRLRECGTGWNKVDENVSGKGELKRATRDRMLSDGVIVNDGAGMSFSLWHAAYDRCVLGGRTWGRP